MHPCPVASWRVTSLILAMVFIATMGRAQVVVGMAVRWDNDSGNFQWSTASNWAPNALPAAGADVLFDNTYVSSAQTVLPGAGATRSVRSIQIDAPFSYTLSTGTLNLDHQGTGGFTGIAVTQRNGAAPGGQVVASAIQLGTEATLRNGATTDLLVSGTVATNGRALRVDGSGTTRLTGVVSGSGSLTKADAGLLSIENVNTYAGGTTLQGGTLRVGQAGGLGSGGVLLQTGTLTGAPAVSLGNALTVDGNVTLSGLTATGSVLQTGGNRTLVLENSTLAGRVVLAENNQARTLTVEVASGVSTVSGVIANGEGTGADGLRKTGQGTLVVGGANTYTGGTVIESGEIRLNGSNRLSDTGAVVLAGGTLDLNTHSEQVGALSWTANSTIDFGQPGTSNTFLVSGITAASGVLTVKNWTSGSDFLGTSTVVGAGILESIYFSGYTGGANIFGSPVANPGGYTGSYFQIAPNTAARWFTWDGGDGSGRWDRADNWVGDTTPPSGARVAFGTGTQTTVDLRADRTVNGLRFDPGSASFTLNNHTLTFESATAGALAVIQQQSSNAQVVNSGVRLNKNTVVDTLGSGTLVLQGALSGSGNLVKEGVGGDLVLSANNSAFTGGIFVNDGTLRATSDQALGATTRGTTVTAGGTVALGSLAAGPSLTIAEGFDLAGEGANRTGALRNAANTNTMTGAVTLSSSARIASDAGTLALAGGVSGNGTALTLAGAGNIDVASGLALGSGALTKEGSGVVTFSGSAANTSTGRTTVNGGTLVLAKSGAQAIAGDLVIGGAGGTATVRLENSHQIADTSTVTLGQGGVFQVNGKTETVGGLASAPGAGQVQLAGGALTVANATENAYAGSFTGNGVLTKEGTGRLALAGNSESFGATVNVNQGVVALQSNRALGNVQVNVANGTTVELQGGISVGNAFTLQGSGANGQGVLQNLSGANTVNGALTLTGDARVTSAVGSLTLAGPISGANRTLTVAGNADTTLRGGLQIGSGSLVKEGYGTLRLAAANSYTGTTTLREGAVILEASSVFSDSRLLTIDAGASLNLNGFNETVGGIAGMGLIEFGGAQLTLASGSSVFGGDFRGSGTLILRAGATLTLSDSFYAPNLNIILEGGTLFLGNSQNHTFGTLSIAGDSVIDFGASGATNVYFTTIAASGGRVLTVNNWTNAVDYFFVQNNPGPQGTPPTNQVDFTNTPVDTWNGNDTRWVPFSNANYGQLTPVPEPSTYGAILLGAVSAFVLWRRRDRSKRSAAKR